VRVLNELRLTLLLAVFMVCVAVPAAADLTVLSHYTLVNGDTLTRASYYSSRRVRVTAPDGREFMFNERGDSITVIDHTNRTYWTGPRSLADSLAKKIMARNREGVPEIATTDPVAWGKRIEAFNDSIQASSTFKSRMIAGYPCDQWILTAGGYLTHERWVARSLDVPNYGPEMQKAMMATIADPLGRQLMRMLVDMYSKEGLVLAASTQFRTLQRNGSYEFEAIRVDGKSLPKSTWLVPKGYKQIKL
jgi:hypothetical protein